MRKSKSVKCEELLLLYDNELSGSKKNRGLNRLKLRVVRWDDAQPILEKRRFFYDEDDDVWIPMRNKGLNRGDLELIMQKQQEIMEVMKNAE